MFKTGQMITISKPARPYKHMGFIDHSYILPAEAETMKIVRISNTKGGTKVHVRRSDNTGYAIYLEQFLANPGFKVELAA